ncbi:hypothetical protein PQX77_021206 [Marasmius sp. AFHP31]|nr:hypothetical protein PQX77_021206 [Marasmius sp. AFHP31]
MGKRMGNPRGRQSWGRGKRLEVLEKHKDLFFKNSSTYYNKVIEEFLQRWGTLDVEIDPDTVDPASLALVDTNTIEDLTERNEEIKRRETWKIKTRTKIRSWASHRWLKKAPETQALNALLQEVKGLSIPRPRRPQPFKYYQNKYWHSKLSTEFEDGRKAKGDTPGTNEKVSVDERNRFAQEKWEAETAEERANIIAEIEAKYQEELEEYKTRCNWTGSAISYHDVWSNSENILSGITDAVGKLFGGGALLFIFGPRSTDGEVDIRSCTGVVPGSQVSKVDMFEFNPEAYKAATSMCVEFGKAAFSSEFCKSRIVSKEALEDAMADKHGEEEGDEASASVGRPSDISKSPSESRQTVTTASSELSPPPPPLSAETTEASPSSPPSSALPAALTPDPGSSLSLPITADLPEVNVNAVEAHIGSTPSEVLKSAEFPATSIPDRGPGTLIQCTQEELNNWLNAANVGGLFGDISTDNPNATSDESDKLQGNPYHQYRTTATNAMPSDEGTFFNSNWNNAWGLNSDAAMHAYSNAGQVEDWTLMQGGFMNTAPSTVQNYGVTAMQTAILPSAAPPAMAPPSSSVSPPSTYTTPPAEPLWPPTFTPSFTDSALPPLPYSNTQLVVTPTATTVGSDQASGTTTPSPSLPPFTESSAASVPCTALTNRSDQKPTATTVSSDQASGTTTQSPSLPPFTELSAASVPRTALTDCPDQTPTATTVGSDQASGTTTPSPSLPPFTESSAASVPRTALTDRSDQTTPSVNRPPSDGAENRPTTKRPDPPGGDITAPPPKKRKSSAPADLSDTIAARKPTRTIIKPTRMGEESDHEEPPASKKARVAPKKKATKGSKSG